MKRKSSSNEDKIKAKVIMVGEPYVGKTTIMRRFETNQFVQSITTIQGGDSIEKTVKVTDPSGAQQVVALRVVDTAGTERYRSLTRQFYKGADAAIVCYDVTDAASFDQAVDYWAVNIREYLDKNKLVLALIGNKADEPDNKRQVAQQRARRFASSNDMFWKEVSAKDNQDNGIEALYQEVAQRIYAKRYEEAKEPQD